MVRNMEEEKRDRIKNLRLKLLWVFIFLICIIIAFLLFWSQHGEATYVSGHITSDTTWNASGNPYIVKDHVWVDEGVNLSIEPDVVIKFDGYYTFYVDGNLNAIGNQTYDIIFTRNELNPSVTDWQGIKIKQNGRAHIENCNISYPYYGVFIEQSSNDIIMNTDIFDSRYGIYLSYSLNITITNTNISDSYEGIHLSYSSNITIIDTNLSESYEGIDLDHAPNLSLSNVQFWNISTTVFDIVSDDDYERRYYNHTIVDCKVNGKPFLYFFDVDEVTIEDLELGCILLAWSSNLTINNCNITNGEGISLHYTMNSTIKNCNLSHNYRGIFLHFSSGSYDVSYPLYNTITNNVVLNNTYGIRLYRSNRNLIVENDIISNDYGIYSYHSYNNWVIHNNFIDNDDQVFETGSYWLYNFWDTGEEGNYWSDYNGSDEHGDGIGDSSYYVNYYSYDNFPLMQPYNGTLPPDTIPPFFESEPYVYRSDLTLPYDEMGMVFETSERGYYEVIIDTDGTKGFDNNTDTTLRDNALGEFQYVYWDGRDNEGNYVEDGDYQIQVMIWDRAGNPIAEPYYAGSVSIIRDMDRDGVNDVDDAFPNDPTESKDFDGDGIGDNSDTDLDNDGVPNHDDAFRWDSKEWADSDDDGIGDNADPDDNGNGIPDIAEIPMVIIVLLIPIVMIYFTNKRIKSKKKEEE